MVSKTSLNTTTIASSSRDWLPNPNGKYRTIAAWMETNYKKLACFMKKAYFCNIKEWTMVKRYTIALWNERGHRAPSFQPKEKDSGSSLPIAEYTQVLTKKPILLDWKAAVLHVLKSPYDCKFNITLFGSVRWTVSRLIIHFKTLRSGSALSGKGREPPSRRAAKL